MQTLRVVLAALGIGVTSAGNATFFVHTMELIPTVFRYQTQKIIFLASKWDLAGIMHIYFGNKSDTV